MSLLPLILAGLFVIAAIVLSACRPRLRDNYVTDQVPAGLSCEELENWLQTHEAAVAGVVDGAEAGIEWASEKQQKTRYCFIYLHGFSATRRETSPVIETLATRYASNIVFVRLSGHGVRPTDELGRAEDWLQDVWNAWQIAAQLGDEVVIVATSTGAPLSVWLASQDKVCERLRAMLFLSPNFRIRNPFGFLLTWPLSVRWIHWIIGAWHEWEPETELHGKFWTSRYRTSSLIEMQKVL
ncbi:MAG: alpha/beta fold hydrolase, partial [Pseudomonadales bacterium]|nr:alpha/beta fold hydrolase [Pseudomonadales bacterium]